MVINHPIKHTNKRGMLIKHKLTVTSTTYCFRQNNKNHY